MNTRLGYARVPVRHARPVTTYSLWFGTGYFYTRTFSEVGLGHLYKGPSGIVDSAYSGLILGGVYLLSGRNLWAAILAHGLSDTFAVVVSSSAGNLEAQHDAARLGELPGRYGGH